MEKDDKKLINETVQETLKILLQSNKINHSISYFQKTEKLLYNYRAIKDSIQHKEDEIKYLEENGLPQKSKSIVMYSTSSRNAEGDTYIDIKEGYQRAKGITEWLIKKIDNALEKIKKDKYYFIIEGKYFNNMTIEDLAECADFSLVNKRKLGSSDRTIQRNKKRLVEKITITLFGAGALEDICEDII